MAGRKDRIAGSIRSGSYHAVKRAEGLDFYQAEGVPAAGNLVHEAVIAMVTGGAHRPASR